MYSFTSLQELFIARLSKEAVAVRLLEPASLYEPVAYTLEVGGKRLRPVMLLMACDLFDGKTEDAMHAALAVEIFHNFTLLHDDIMDKADMRRNMPTVYRKYDENTAILSGDAMSIMAFRYLLKTESPALMQIVALFTRTAIEVCEGQQFDMDFEKRTDVSISEYLKMIRMKTAVLVGCSFKAGALIGGATDIDARRLYDFGINAGLAFQLQDDLLDVYADPEVFGKKTGNDIVSNKKTFLLLKALEVADKARHEELIRWISKKEFDPEEKTKAVKAIYDELDIKALTERVIRNFYDCAKSGLEDVRVNSAKRSELLLLIEGIMERDR